MQIDAEKVKAASMQLKASWSGFKTGTSKDQLRGYEGEAEIYFGVRIDSAAEKDFQFQDGQTSSNGYG